ncbi:Inner membrane protein YjiY [compost metagenome]
MQNVIMNAYTNAGLSVLFLVVVFSVLFYALKVGRAAWIRPDRSDKETAFKAMPGV